MTYYYLRKENKEKWVESLRSGKFKQSRGKFKDNGEYCALGVYYNIFKADKDDLFSTPLYFQIILLNDIKNYSFNEIADWVEENVMGV